MGKNGNSGRYYFLGLQKSLQTVTAAMKLNDACSWKKSYDKPRQHIKKWRHHFTDKGPYSQSYGFSCSHVWVWELDHKVGWAWTFNAFELWCWRRCLRVPCTARTSNQSVLKEMNPEYSLEVLKLKLQYFDNLVWRADLLGKTLMLKRLRTGGEGGNRGWDSWMTSEAWMASLIQ